MCTSITFTTTDGQGVFGRTQEYNVEYDYVGVQFQRGYKTAIPGYSWETDYSVLGVGIRMDGAVAPMVVDGVNEYGLTATTQYFADEFRYATAAEIKEAGKTPVYAEQFIFYILAHCKNICEVRKIVEGLAISTDSFFGQEGGFPQHFLIRDQLGDTIVIEPSVKLGFKVFDNPVGVMTNNPSFDWHLSNLRNYAGISSKNRTTLQLKNTEINFFGKGSGLFGLPADYTSPSRFIRASMLLNFAKDVPSKDAINLGFHILSTSDIPKGVIDLDSSLQYTQYTVVYQQHERALYLKLYDNLDIQKIAFDDSASNGGATRIVELRKQGEYTELA